VGLLLVVELPHLTQEALVKEYYIGLDVHKDSVLMAVLDDRKVRSTEKADSDVIGLTEVRANFPAGRGGTRDVLPRQGTLISGNC
jgi:hypothetical protein